MNLIEKWKQYRTIKRVNRLESDLKLIANKDVFYNGRYVPDTGTQEEFTYRIAQYFAWFSGSSKRIREFETTQTITDTLFRQNQMFWKKAPNNYYMVHSGIPNLIARKMAIILFGDGFKKDIQIYNKVTENNLTSNKRNEEAEKKAYDILEVLTQKLKLNELLEKAAQLESVGGHVFFKISIDTDLTKWPILDVADIRNAEIKKVRGITKEIIFKNYITKKENNKEIKYEHHEVYTTTPNGDACILNELYKRDGLGGLKPCDLSLLEETRDLEELHVFEGIKGLLAFEKPNKLPNAEFLDSNYGASDYTGAIEVFDALDEILSGLFEEVRFNKTIRQYPSTMVDPNGVVNPFATKFVKIEQPLDQGVNIPIETTVIQDKTEQHRQKWMIAIGQACNICGLSPLSLGITGLESINSSDKSQKERVKTTLETRDSKWKLWKPFLEEIFIRLLETTSWLQKKGFRQDGIDDIDIDWANIQISVTPNEYLPETKTERITAASMLKQSQGISTEMLVNYVWGDEMTQEQKDEEIARIKFEQGTNLDNPNNLQLNLEEPKDEIINKLQEDNQNIEDEQK